MVSVDMFFLSLQDELSWCEDLVVTVNTCFCELTGKCDTAIGIRAGCERKNKAVYFAFLKVSLVKCYSLGKTCFQSGELII